MKKNNMLNLKDESGNVLFLILIAVALFAALSYAVTQSSRSGGGDVGGEKSLVSSSEITQYPAGVRTSIMRMIVSNGISPDQLMFNAPTDFDGTVITTGNQGYAVFHPSGGGGTYQSAPPAVMANPAAGQGAWHFNANFQVKNIGTTSATTDTSGNDVIAFLRGVSKGICQKIDDQLGIGTIPVIASALTASDLDDDQVASANGATTSTFPSAAGAVITHANLDGQPFACFENGTSSGSYVYYHVLIER